MSMHFDTTGHPGPEAIVAIIDGTASPEVASHVHGCAECSAEADELRSAQTRLRHALYRFDCPSPHELGEYELGFVAAEERVRIAAHALECSLCTDELQTLRGFMATEPQFKESFASQVRRAVATLLAPLPSTALMGVRGADTQLRQYQIENARLSIQAGADPGSLIGLLVPGAPGEARLVPEHGQPYVAELDDLGNFDFEGVPPGAYTLEIELADEIIVVQQLEVSQNG